MIQEKLIGQIRGMMNSIDVGKLINIILLFLIFFVTVFLLVFTGMFGHIISDELHRQRIQVLESISNQTQMFEKTIKALHPHYLIESPIHRLDMDSKGILYIDGKPVKNKEELNEFLSKQRVIKRLEGEYDH